MEKEIEFEAEHGSKMITCRLTKVFGSGAGSYHVYIDRYYHGAINLIGGNWTAHMNPNSDLSPDELHSIIDLIKENESQ